MSGENDSGTRPVAPTFPGAVRLTSERAKQLLRARFAAAGVELEADYELHEGELAVTLEAFDPRRRIGFAYITDGVMEVRSELDTALAELARQHKAWVLVVHDADIPNADVLERRIDAFFQQLP